MDRQLTLPLTQLYHERSILFFTRPQLESQSQKYSSDWSIGNFLGSPYQKRGSLYYKRMPYLVDQLLRSSKVIITTNNRKETTENIFLYFRHINSKYHRFLVFVPNEFREQDLYSIFNDQWKNMIEQPRNYPLTSFTQENDSSIKVVTPKDTLRFIHDPEEHLFECEPRAVFIPDVDRFPQSQLLMLIPIIRLLQWADPEMEVILTAAPLANLDSIRNAFFEEPQTCKILQKEEFRGILTTRVHKMEKLTLNRLLNSIYRFIYEETDLYLEDNQYLPKKGLFFFPKNPLLLEEFLAQNVFTQNFIVVHKQMTKWRLLKELQKFKTNPTKICLVCDEIIHEIYNPPEMYWGIMWGLPSNPRIIWEIQNNLCRNPEVAGQLDILIPPELPYYMKGEKKEEIIRKKLTEYLTTPPTILLPPLPSKIVQFFIILGVMMERWRIIPMLEMKIREDYNFTKAMKTLLKQEIITYDSQKGFRITKSTWKWYKGFRSNSFRRTLNETYSLRIHKSYPPKKEELIQYGSIPLTASQVLHYFLPNQMLQWRGNTYQITKIDNEYNTLYGVPLMMESSGSSQKENPVEELIVISEVLKKREIRNISDDLTYEIILVKLTLVEQLVDIPEEKHDFIISRVKGELSVQQEMEGIICKLPLTHSEGIMSTIHRYMRLDRNFLEIKPFTSKKTPCFIILDKSGLEYVHVIFDGWSEWLK